MILYDDTPVHTNEQMPIINAFPKVRAPWRRFFARNFDFFMYGVLLMTIQMLVFNINIANRTSTSNIIDTFLTFLPMILLEPLLLKLFGTTPGKWLLGLYITDEWGKKLSYVDGLSRILTIFWRGYGLNIPIYNLIRQYKSYSECAAGETLDWELDSIVHLKDEKNWRVVSYIAGLIVLFAVIVICVAASMMPKNRGDITVSEFAENYNKFSDFYYYYSSNKLNEAGQWISSASDGNVIYISGPISPPDFIYTEENGIMTGMQFIREINVKEIRIPSFGDEMILSLLSFVRAQEGSKLLNNEVMPVIEYIQERPFSDFKFTVHGITIICDYTYSGYEAVNNYSSLIPNEDEEQSFLIEFKMFKE